MKQDHRPWENKTFSGGANTDVAAEEIGKSADTYRNARNMQLVGTGKELILSRIKGEDVMNGPDVSGGETYRCVGLIEVRGRRVGFWASSIPDLYPPLVQVDGMTVAYNSAIPYRFDQDLQLSQSEDGEVGIVFDARSGTTPIHWDISHLLQEVGNDTYFEGFSLSSVQVNPTRAVSRVLFRGLEWLGDGGGNMPGQYFYALRYANFSGDRTPDGPEVGPVMVPWNNMEGWQSNVRPVPDSGITGSTPGSTVGQRSRWGMRLTFRVSNTANFDTIEVVRWRYSENAGIDAVPAIEVIHRQNVIPGENAVYDIVDTGKVLDAISTDENLVRTHYIKSAKSVRYIDHRVVYGGVELGRKDMSAPIVGGGPALFPITKNLWQEGHSNPVHHCYFKRFQSGERYGIGRVYHDIIGGTSFVDPVDPNYQMPSRRTKKEGDSLRWSDSECYAANTENEVTPTFEVFDHTNAIGRSQTGQIVNIMEGSRRRISATKAFPSQAITQQTWGPGGPGSEVFFTPDGNEYGDNNHGAYVPSDGVPGGPYLRNSYTKPLQPISPTSLKWGHDYRPNTAVVPSGRPDGASTGYNPKVFGVSHHALGMAFRGIDSFPNDTQGFSMVITRPARRVVAQGLFTWSLSTDGSTTRKGLFEGRLSIPDHAAGAMSQEAWENIIADPGRYKIQFVSPLGFASEQMGSAMFSVNVGDLNGGANSWLADVMSYARVLWDNGQINPCSGGGFQTSGVPGQNNFVGYGAWRGAEPAGQWQGQGGDALLPINEAIERVHPTGARTLILRTDRIYQHETSGSTDVENAGTKNFQEPFYVVNIVEDGLQVNDTEGYVSANHYQAWRVNIGTLVDEDWQRLRLADERLDDVRGTRDGDERFIWVNHPLGFRPFLNEKHFPFDRVEIATAILNEGSWVTPNGVRVYGLFRVEQTLEMGENMLQDVLITAYHQDQVGQDIEVRYNKDVPVQFFGDRVTSPMFATMVDERATVGTPLLPGQTISTVPSSGNQSVPAVPSNPDLWGVSGSGFRTNGLPIPFANYRYNDRYMVPFGRGWGAGAGFPNGNMACNQHSDGTIMSVRQWKVLFDVETIAPAYLQMYDGTRKSYPNVQYVPRPYNFRHNESYEQNGLMSQYPSVYGEAERTTWEFGGIKDKMEICQDYMVSRPPAFWRKNDFAFIEETNLEHTLIWSEKATPSVIDSPGLKTFPVNNTHHLQSNQGPIQYLFREADDLYAVCEKGVWRVMVSKSTAYSADGDSFATFAQDAFVGQVLTVSASVGMPGDTWKNTVEGSPQLSGVQRDALFWWDGRTVQMLAGGSVQDIAGGIYTRPPAQALEPGTGGVYDQKNHRLMLMVGGRLITAVFTKYGMKWEGYTDHLYDKMVYANEAVYGVRDLYTYMTGHGDILNNAFLSGSVDVVSAPYPGHRKRWMRVKAVSARKPSRIEFFDDADNLVSWMDAATFGPHYLKLIDGWEHWVPRNNVAMDPERKTLQGGRITYRIIFNEPGDDSISLAATIPAPLK